MGLKRPEKDPRFLRVSKSIKGRKMRCTPLGRNAAKVLREWMLQQGGNPEDPVVPSSNGERLSADGLQQLMARHIATARKRCPSRPSKTVTPHPSGTARPWPCSAAAWI